MIERVRLADRVKGGGNYFASPKTEFRFLPSGCTILDLALGGGWVEDHVINIVGDKSTGKTLLCIEAAANFAVKYPKGKIKYRECEAAFSQSYAAALGMPINRVDFGKGRLETVEDLYNDLKTTVQKAKEPTLYILDSLDALGDVADMEREITKGTYGGAKPKAMGKLFRDLVGPMEDARVTLIIVSQVRSFIGFTIGKTITRSGGRALDFYASQALWLYYTGKLKKKVDKIERITGVAIKGKVEKNKVGFPWREASFPILFGYGIDDNTACERWMKENGGKWPATKVAIENRWHEIESSFLPTRKKYAT